MKINILDMFENTTAKKKDDVAVIHNAQSVTFGELMDRAKRVATSLLSYSDLNRPVAVFMPKEIETVVIDIAVMYAGCPFMNLDVKTPKERIENTIELIKPSVVVTQLKYSSFFDEIDVKVLIIDQLNETIDETALKVRHKMLIDTDPMCLINTSGSTGTPKGVVLNHRSFFDFLYWATERFNFDGDEIIGSLSPVVFDIFDFELCMLMIHGSKLVLLDASLAAFPVRLLEMLNEKKVNFIFWVPSIMVNIANMNLLKSVDLPFLKTVWFAGEVFPTKQFLYWYDKLPKALFVNLYGPIEITLDCTYYVVEERPVETEALPIGVACRNTDILILNERDEKCSEGEEGELCVRGTSLAMGYYNNPEKTSIAFTQNPLNSSYPELIYRTGDVVCIDRNGLIQFKGRKDTLIKHMGYRIELGEIEHVMINDLKLIKYCCAVYRYSKKEIVLYYESEEEITPMQFRNSLKKVLPVYMIPSVYIRTEFLPRNANGKIDRLLLKKQANEEES